MTLLSLENLSKRYGALVVTDELSLAVPKGEIVGILGPNGAGKTTLFNLIAGTVKADQGRVIGRAAEDPEAHALKVMELTGMRGKANHLAGSVSLLERKRLEMARALATEPDLLLLDEIAGGLTERECQSLLSAIRDVHGSGVTIVWIEHVVHALLSVAQRLVVLNFGRVIADGAPQEVMNSKDVKSVYLGEDAHV